MNYRFISGKEHLHQLYKDGEWKNLTGTSSIGSVLFKPLAWWAAGMAVQKLGVPDYKVIGKIKRGEAIQREEEELKTGVEKFFTFLKDKTAQEYQDLLFEAYSAHDEQKKEKADLGTDLHAELEHFVKAMMGKVPMRADYDQKIQPFIEWSEQNVKQFICSEANCYSERLWLGGVIDAIAELKDGTLAVIDFKSAKEVYPTHLIQACLYAIQAMENGLWDSDGKHNKKLDKSITKLIIFPFGAEDIKPEIRNFEDYKIGAEAAVLLYRMLGLEDRIKKVGEIIK